MAWSEYSRFVGDVFGAPLAMEALVAFFVESTFLGLWIFGWDKLPKKIHLACIWAVALATILSAYFILAANSWMQHPVGAMFNAERGRAEMTDIGAVLSNTTLLAAFPHTISAAFLTAGTFVVGIAAWWMHLVRAGGRQGARRVPARRRARRDRHARLGRRRRDQRRPAGQADVRAAADEDGGRRGAVRDHGQRAVLAARDRHVARAPTATRSRTCSRSPACSRSWPPATSRRGPGHRRAAAEYEEKYGYTDATGEPISYIPNLAVTYWGFRLMIGFGASARPRSRSSAPLADPHAAGSNGNAVGSGGSRIVALATPFLANGVRLDLHRDGPPAVGRRAQPEPGRRRRRLAAHRRGVSTVQHGHVLTSLIAFTLLYGVLAVVWYRLMHRYASRASRTASATRSPDNPDNDAGRRTPTGRWPSRTERGRRPWSSRRLVRPHRRPVDRLLLPGGLRLRRRDAAQAARPRRPRSRGRDRRVLINTIGPVWDGNEVWLLTAGGATFAAFPEWYATLFSGFYLPLLLILLALIVRGVAFEYRGKVDDAALAARWDRCSSSARGCPPCSGASRSPTSCAG